MALSSPLEIYYIHPAVVKCQVSCLNRQAHYSPAMALIVSGQELIKVYDCASSSRDGLSYKVHYTSVSYCEEQNNYTMEFEYLIYSNSFKINHAVVKCGVRLIDWHMFTNYSRHTCWGQSYGMIYYDSESTPTGTSTSTDWSYDTCPGIGLSLRSSIGWLMPTLISTIILFTIIITMTGGFLYARLHRGRFKPNAIAPSFQIVEETLVIKVEDSITNDEEMREKESSFSEGSNRLGSVQVQLDQKLPDTISSRE